MKMMAATLARIGALRFDAMPLGFVFALRARIALAETNFKKVIQAGFIIAKLREKFSDCHAVFVAVVPVFHALNIRLNRYVCQGDNSEIIVSSARRSGRFFVIHYTSAKLLHPRGARWTTSWNWLSD
jgi:hypothetical protein